MDSTASTSRTRLAAIALSCAAIAGGFWFLHRGTPQAVAEPSRAPAAVPSAALVATTPVVAAPVPAPFIAASASMPAHPSSLAANVDQWSRSRDPADAMRAYDAVAKCLLARKREHRPPEEFKDIPVPPETAAQICGDLRSDQIQARTQWVTRAAAAGVKDAAVWFIQEGPSGNGLLREFDTPDFDDDLTDDWLKQRDAYIDLALRNCDLGLEAYLTRFARGVPADIDGARQYWINRLVCPGPNPAPTLVPLSEDPLAQRMLQGLRHGPDGNRLPGS